MIKSLVLGLNYAKGRNELDYIKLNKEISYALRHAPWEYQLELDNEGWVPVSQLIDALNQNIEWKDVTEQDIQNIINKFDKKRFEINENKIRALYGHSVPFKIEKTPIKPPDILYHGTTNEAYKRIIVNGLLPQSRQYVHLSLTMDVAKQVGLRRCKEPVILVVNAGKAYKEKIKFYKGNEFVWLADKIPPKYITLIDNL